MRQDFRDPRCHCWRANRLRSGSYLAGSTGGPPLTMLRQHIEQQNQPA
jgi:putative transposase